MAKTPGQKRISGPSIRIITAYVASIISPASPYPAGRPALVRSALRPALVRTGPGSGPGNDRTGVR